jgi:hypothetical protein
MTEVTYVSLGSSGLEIAVPFDMQRRKERDSSGNFKPEKNIQFGTGRSKLDMNGISLTLNPENPEDAFKIKVLDRHKGNQANGGNSFKKMDKSILTAISIKNGETYAEKPDDMSEGDIENLKYLSSIKPLPTMPPNQIKKIVKTMENVYERFKIAGIGIVDENTKPKILYARSLDVLGTLEERGIWNNGDTEGEGSS